MTLTQRNPETLPTDMPATAMVQTRPQASLPVDTPQTDEAGVISSSHPAFNDEGAPAQTRPQTLLPASAPPTDRDGEITSSRPVCNHMTAPAQTRPQISHQVDAPQTDEAGGGASSLSPLKQEAGDGLKYPVGEQNAAAFPYAQEGKDESLTASIPVDTGDKPEMVVTDVHPPKPDPANAAARDVATTAKHEAQQGTYTTTPLQPLPDQVKTAKPENIAAPIRQGFFGQWFLPLLQPIHTAIRCRWPQFTQRWYHWRDTRQGPEQARQWLESLDWYRLRYQSAPLTKQGLQVLAGATGCGRVALVHTLYPWPHLYLGLPSQEGDWARQVAADYQFRLHPAPAPDALLTLRLQPADGLNWQRPFLSHLVGDRLLVVYQDAAASDTGYFWPEERVVQEGQNWQLPDKPPLGLTTRPQLPPVEIPKAMQMTGKPDSSRWLLGHASDGTVLQAPTPQVRVVGNEDAVTLWLEQAALANLALQPVGLVILDGEGTLTHRLRRHALVNALLNRKQLTLASIMEAGDSRLGFNPLARVPGESEVHTVTRWQTWFAGMGCSWQSRTLLLEAYREGITELNQLHRWLEQPAHLGQQHTNALLSLKTAVHRLITAATVRDWLEWPTNLFAHLTDKAVLFACPGSSAWERQQLWQAMLLGVQAAGQARLILTGTGEIPSALDPEMRVLAGNGRFLPGATQIITTLNNTALASSNNLTQFKHKSQLEELMPLLGPGESVILFETGGLRLAW